MAYNSAVFAGSLANINIGVSAALSVLNPLLTLLDLVMFGPNGLAALQAQFALQLQAQLKAQLAVGLAISNPFIGFSIALAAAVSIVAQITALLALAVNLHFALPTISFSFSFSASLQISAMLQLALSLKIPALTLAAQLALGLSLGPIFAISWENIPLIAAGGAIGADFAAGLAKNGHTIFPGEAVYGVLLVMKSPAAWGAVSGMLLVS